LRLGHARSSETVCFEVERAATHFCSGEDGKSRKQNGEEGTFKETDDSFLLRRHVGGVVQGPDRVISPRMTPSFQTIIQRVNIFSCYTYINIF